jgi:N-acyl-D-amino-acid deacylase
VSIAPSIAAPATRVIDLSDFVAAPGFIDIHTHASRAIFEVPTADNYVRQGVTTVMEGADGGGSGLAGGLPVPLKPFLDRLEATPKSINVASFIGQGAVREAVIGLANCAPSADQLERMREVVRQGMKDGAFGLSTGLFYVPGAFTPLDEVVELQKVVAPFRGVHTSHMRDQGSRVVESVKETIVIGELGRVPTHVSHHQINGELGQEHRNAATDRCGAGSRRRCDARCVSIHRREHHDPSGAAAGMGVGRRHWSGQRAFEGPGNPGKDQSGDNWNAS